MSLLESFVDVMNQVEAVQKLESGVLKATEDERKKRTSDLFDDDDASNNMGA